MFFRLTCESRPEKSLTFRTSRVMPCEFDERRGDFANETVNYLFVVATTYIYAKFCRRIIIGLVCIKSLFKLVLFLQLLQ